MRTLLAWLAGTCGMPVIRSAKKALRQSKRRQVRNLKRKKAIRDVVKKIRKLNAAGKKDEAAALISQAYKAFDKAAKTGVMKKNTAARKKSRLVKSLSKDR